MSIKIRKKKDLWANGIRIYVDGVEHKICDTYIPDDDAKIEIYHESFRNKLRSKFLKPLLNTQKHERGINKEMSYYLISFGLWKKPCEQTVVPLHRLLYIWFYDDLEEGMDVGHINCDSLDNRLSNLKQMTRKENLAMRTGAINQYGLKKSER